MRLPRGYARARAVSRLCWSSRRSKRASHSTAHRIEASPALRRETASGLKCAGFYQVGLKMKLLVPACAAIAAAMFGGAVHANEKLAQSSGCMTCHSVDKKIIGPSFNEVAAKYR